MAAINILALQPIISPGCAPRAPWRGNTRCRSRAEDRAKMKRFSGSLIISHALLVNIRKASANGRRRCPFKAAYAARRRLRVDARGRGGVRLLAARELGGARLADRNAPLMLPGCNAFDRPGGASTIPKNRDYSDRGKALGRTTVTTGCTWLRSTGIRSWPDELG